MTSYIPKGNKSDQTILAQAKEGLRSLIVFFVPFIGVYPRFQYAWVLNMDYASFLSSASGSRDISCTSRDELRVSVSSDASRLAEVVKRVSRRSSVRSGSRLSICTTEEGISMIQHYKSDTGTDEIGRQRTSLSLVRGSLYAKMVEKYTSIKSLRSETTDRETSAFGRQATLGGSVARASRNTTRDMFVAVSVSKDGATQTMEFSFDNTQVLLSEVPMAAFQGDLVSICESIDVSHFA